MYRLPPRLLRSVRVVLALYWLYEGVWAHVLRPSMHELGVIAAIGAPTPLTPPDVLHMIGAAEMLLSLAVLSARLPRVVAVIQFVVLVCATLIGMDYARRAVADAIGVLVHHVPLALCIYVAGEGSAVPARAAPPVTGPRGSGGPTSPPP